MLERPPAVAAAEQDCRGAGRARGSEPADDVRRASACRERHRDVAVSDEGPHLPLEHFLEGVVVGDARQRRRIRRERLGRERPALPLEAADELLGEMVRVDGATAVPERVDAASRA